MTYREQLDRTRIPTHIAIIMDGNGRWARQRGLSRNLGHQEGIEAVRKVTEECTRIGVKYLTLYTFSTENWNRPKDEISALMGLVLSSLEDEIFMKNNVRFRVIGDIGRLSREVQDKLRETEEHTAGNDAMTMVVALSYSARWEIAKAVGEIVDERLKAEDDELKTKEVTEAEVSRHLQTAFMPDPDLLIRTGGELRISNFLLWQCAYTEFYFCDTFWPDFDGEALCKAVLNYQKRERRFGKTSEQIKEKNEQNPK